jgi:hypothetical protein
MERLIQERVWRGSDTSVLKRALGIDVGGEQQAGGELQPGDDQDQQRAAQGVTSATAKDDSDVVALSDAEFAAAVAEAAHAEQEFHQEREEYYAVMCGGLPTAGPGGKTAR